MKKRIGIIFVLIFAVLGFTACNKDPYSKMKMTVNTNDIVLTLTDADNEIVGSSTLVNVSVDAPKNIDKGIVLPKYGSRYGNECVDVEIASTDGDGNYSLKFTALQVGNSEIQIKSKEGYVSQTIRVNIEVKIESLDFTSEASNTGIVVEAGTEYNLNTYRDSLIDFKPSYTSQRAVKYTIVEGEVEKVDATKNNYCIIEDNILKVGSGYSGTGTVKIKAQSVASLENTELKTSNTLKVTIVKLLDMSSNVIDATLIPEGLAESKSITITQTSSMSGTNVAYYDLVFASPEGEHSASRDVFGGNLKFGLSRRTDYEIVLDGGQSTVVDVNDLGSEIISKTYTKSFNFMAKESDEKEDVVQFKVIYKGKGDYDGLQTKFIKVRVKIVALPTSQTVLINGTPYSQAKTFAVYDGISSEMIIESSNNKEMTFKLAESAGSFDINSDIAGASYIEVKKGNELIEKDATLTSGDVLYFKNCTKDKALVDLRVTLTVNIYNEHYSEVQQYSMDITIKINLITGLNELIIDDMEVDVENDKAGVVLAKKIGDTYETYTLPEGVLASSVVESISIGNSSLFTYELIDNNIVIYPHPYTVGDTTINEGMTSITIRLNNGVISKTSSDGVTRITIKASYAENKEVSYNGKPVVVTNIDTESDGFFSWGSIKEGATYTDEFVDGSNYYRASSTNSIKEYDTGFGNVSYPNGSSLILSTYSELSLELYKLFVYKDDKGRGQIGKVNVNKLTAKCYDNEGNQTANITWADGILRVGENTSWNEITEKHEPFKLKIYDNVDGSEIFGINIYVCHRIGKITITQKHFDLYDATDGYLNEVYSSKATAEIELTIYPIIEKDGRVQISTTGYKITDIISDGLCGQYGNLYFSAQMLYGDSIVYGALAKSNLITTYEDETSSDYDPYKFIAQCSGSGIEDLIANAYSSGKVQKVSYSGILEQFTQQFPVEFDFSISRPTKIKSITTNVFDPGIYFKLDSADKKYQLKYNYYPSNAQLNDVYVIVEKYNGTTLEKTMPLLVYAGADSEGALYKYYANGFNVDTFLGDDVKSENEWRLSGGYFVVNISKNGYMTITASEKCDAGSYKVTIASVASVGVGLTGSTFDFNIADGTSANPYQLMGVLDFEEFMLKNATDDPSEPTFEKEYYVISKDIYLNKVYSNFSIIGNTLLHNLSGLYNGNRHSIYNLKISLSGDVSKDVALFSNLNEGVVLSNVSVENAEITIETNSASLNNVAILVGSLATGQVYGCRVYGIINFTNKGNKSYNIGGIVGSYTGGSISEIPSEVSINNSDISSTVNINYSTENETSSNLGGIVGYASGVTLDNLRAVATIVAKKIDSETTKETDYAKANIGGVVGNAEGSTVIINVISYPILVGYGNIGGIVGNVSGSSKIAYSQTQLLYNINMKNVIAGVGSIGGIVGNADDVTLDYVYVRSYISKTINIWSGNNLAFYTSYKNQYYGGIIALSGSSNIGGLLGNGVINATNSNFNSHLVSFESDSSRLNIGGIVGSTTATTLADSYVNAKILIVKNDKTGYLKSNNIITAPTNIEQKFGNPTDESIAISGIETISTSDNKKYYLANADDYVTMVITRKWENAVVTYTAHYTSLNLTRFYSFTNNNMFGIDTNKETAIPSTTYSYKTYSDKLEKITLVIYRTSDNKLRMLGKKEVLENTSNGQEYKEYLMSSDKDLENDITTLSDDVKEQLLGLGLSSVNYSSGASNFATIGNSINDKTYKLEYSAKYLESIDITTSSHTTLSSESTLDDIKNYLTNFSSSMSSSSGDIIARISQQCSTEQLGKTNNNNLTLVKEYAGTTVAYKADSGDFDVVFVTTFDGLDGLTVKTGAVSGSFNTTTEVANYSAKNYILNVPSAVKKIDASESSETDGYTDYNINGTIYLLGPVSIIVEDYNNTFTYDDETKEYITADEKYKVDVENGKVYNQDGTEASGKCFINQQLEVASRDVELNTDNFKNLYSKTNSKDVFDGFNFVNSESKDVLTNDTFTITILGTTITIESFDVSTSTATGYIEALKTKINEAYSTETGNALVDAYLYIKNNQLYVLSKDYSDYTIDKITLKYKENYVDADGNFVYEKVVDSDGNPVYEKEADGSNKLDSDGNPIQATTIVQVEKLYTYNVIGRATISFTDDSLAKWVIDGNVNSGLPTNVFANSNGCYGDTTNTPALSPNNFETNYKLYYDELINLSVKALDFKQNTTSNDYISEDTLNPHGHIKVNDTTIALMYSKPLDNNNVNKANDYYITYGEEGGVYVAQLDGEQITLDYVEVSSDLSLYITSSDTGVVTIERDGDNKFKLTTQGEGVAEINFYNMKDDSIKATLTIYVIKGFTNFTINSETNSTQNIDLLVGAEESTDAVFSFINEIDGRNYEANKGGFKLTVTKIDEKDNGFWGGNYSSIIINRQTINTELFKNDSKEFNFDGSVLNFVAVNRGSVGTMTFKVMPYVIIGGEKVYIESLNKTLEININTKAENIAFMETSSEQLPEEEKAVTVTFYSNDADETLWIKITGTDLSAEVSHNIGVTNYQVGDIVDVSTSLLRYRVKGIEHKLENINGVSLYKHSFTLAFYMNSKIYQERTESTGYNAIANSVSYRIVAYPQSHCNSLGTPSSDAINSTYSLTINPVKATRLGAKFYPYLSTYDRWENVSSNVNDIVGYSLNQIYDINSLPVGEYGLLKIETNPKYNNTLILQVQFDSKYTGMVNFRQIIPSKASKDVLNTYGFFKTLKNTSLGDNINVNNTFVLWETPYYEEYSGASGGDPYKEWYFNEYYVALHLSSNCPENVIIPITISAFDANRNKILSYTINLKTEAIPHASITIDGSSSVIKGVDEYVPLEISAKNYGTLTLTGSEIYTRDSNGTYTEVTNINTSYNNNTQYYIHTYSDGSLYKNYIGEITLKLTATNTINGQKISATSKVTVQVVWLLLESVVEPDVISGTITLKTGMYKGLHTSMSTNKSTAEIEEIVANMATNREDINGLTLSEYLQSIQNQIAGRGSGNDTIHWYYNLGSGYTLLREMSYNIFTFSRYDGADEPYYRISAIQISTVQFKLGFYYTYNSDGCIVIGSSEAELKSLLGSDNIKIFAYDYEFKIEIKDNSNEDHPIPIYTAEDLRAMEKDANYILQSDITLNAWKPMDFNSTYLDGNGYTIILKSFDMSDLKGKEEAYAGIFKTVAEGSILKNLTIDVSNLLYNDTTLSSVKNDKTTPNIDLRETPTVYFGIVAGENLGTIINAKVVNLNSRNSGNTLYVAVTRNYFSYDEDKIMSQGNIGGLVAINSGTITNSYIGVNSNSKVERTERKNDGSNDCTNIYSTVNPFKIESCNNVGGFVWSNSGVITNSYIKGISIVNDARVSDNSSTAGFVINNSGRIYSSAVTTNSIKEFRSEDTVITSSSITGGFAYSNSGTIEDAYTNIQINNQNVETAGFVYSNANGNIKNSYTTSKNTKIEAGLGNTDSHKMFVYDKTSYGTIENCYYLIYGDELGDNIKSDDVEILKSLDPANAIILGASGTAEKSLFDGFNFASRKNDFDGVWYFGTGETFPELAYAENVDYYSARSLVNISKTYFELDTTSTDLGVVVYQNDGGRRKELDSKNSLEEKTNVWYFGDGNYLFEVVGNIITEVNSSTKMETTLHIGTTENDSYIEFEYKSKTYKWYYNDTGSGFKVDIDSTIHHIKNLSFNYLGFEFITIVDKYQVATGSTTYSEKYSMVTNDGFSIVTLSEEPGTSKKTFSYGGNSTYTYTYVKNNLGTKYNPIIVTNPLEFAKNIVNNTNEYLVDDNGTTKRLYVFGLTENDGDGAYARYIHVANNISFQNDGTDDNNTADINIASKYEVNNSTAKITINDVIFNGVLIGNSMAIDNIVLNSTETRENYGIFNEVGVNDYNRLLLSKSGINLSDMATAQVFNIELNYKELSNSDANKVGLLAGTISNAVVNKVDISGVNSSSTNYKIQGKNLTGALAGYIYGYNGSTKISEITVNNVSVISSTNKLNNLEQDKLPTDQSYTKFKASKTSIGQEDTYSVTLNMEWKEGRHIVYSNITNLNDLSYAGSIAGAIVMDTVIAQTGTTTVTAPGGDPATSSEAMIYNKYLSNIDNYYSYNELRKSVEYEYVSDLQVSGMVNIQSDISGGIAGYMGTGGEEPTIDITTTTTTTTTTTKSNTRSFASNLKFVLDDDVDQFIFGYAYAGGIVGQSQNAYFREVNVAHLEEVQNEIDKKINNEKFTSSDVSSERLFWKGAGDTDSKIEAKHNVAIGGIVGNMHSSWIVDSSSKANVENSNSFIAGGIAGRVTGSNYLAFVYTIGNVLGKNIVGGVVGYYYNTASDYNLNLYNVFGVNIWSSSIKDLLSVNEKAYKYTYTGTSGTAETLTPSANPDAFEQIGEFNSMPELGNQQVAKTVTLGAIFKEGSDTDKKDYSEKRITIKIDPNFSGFASYERFTYIGSVVGRYTKNGAGKTETMSQITFYDDMGAISSGDELEDIVGRTNIVASDDGATTEEYYTYYNSKNFNVISSTYGNVKHEGSIAEGNYLSTIKDDKVYLSHFTTVYDATENSEKYDNHSYENFNPMFGNQYYVSYITGDFFINIDTSENYGNKYYRNEFTTYYGYVYKIEKGDSYSNPTYAGSPVPINDGIYLTDIYLNVVKAGTESLGNRLTEDGVKASFVWYVEAEYYLAKYGYNSNSTLIQIDSNDTLDTVLLSGKSDMMYRFVENKGATGTDEYEFTSTVNGQNRITLTNNTYYASSDHPVIINFTIDSSTGYSNLFNLIMGCSFTNITFNITITNATLSTSNADNYYGSFASVIQSSSFNNCHFVVTAPTSITPQTMTGNDDGVTSFGLIMGLASNSTFVGCTFNVGSSDPTSSNITVNDNGNLINFGAVASYVFQSVFVMPTTPLNINVRKVTLTGVNQNDLYTHNFGRVFGHVHNSTLNNVKDCDDFIYNNFTVNATKIGAGNYNLGSFAGKIQGTSNLGTIDIQSTYNYNISAGSGLVNAGTIGYTDGISMGDENEETSIRSSYNRITTVTNANVGIIGLAEGDRLESSFTNINIDSIGIKATFKGTTTSHNVGGFIGRKTSTAGLKLLKCVIDCPVKVDVAYNAISASAETTSSKSTTYVGGFVGMSAGLTIVQSVTLRDLTVTAVGTDGNGQAEFNNKIVMGGAIGYNSSSKVTLTNVITYGDMNYYVNANSSKNFRAGGFVGDLNNKTLEATYALALGNFINKFTYSAGVNYSQVNGIANNYNKLTLTHTHYIAEHSPKTAFDSTLNALMRTSDDDDSVAWMYYNFVNKTGKLENVGDCLVDLGTSGVVQPKVGGLTYSTLYGSKYNPTKLGEGSGLSGTIDSGEYYIISGSSENMAKLDGDLTIKSGAVLTSADQTGQGAILNLQGHTISNNGTISNIIFNVPAQSYTGAYVLSTNNGYLMNVGISGSGSSGSSYTFSGTSAPIGTNNGGIYAVGSLISATGITVGTNAISFLTGTNNGEIINCYSTNDLQGSTSQSAVNFGAMAYKNNGTISRSYFAGQLKLTSISTTYELKTANSNMAYVNTIDVGTISKVASYSSSKSPAGTANSRVAITSLVSENGYLKNNLWTDSRGGVNSKFPYITNGILLTKNYGDGYEITTVEELNDWIDANESVGTGKTIIINISNPTENVRAVEGHIKENNGTIQIQNFSNNNNVIINEKFIETNNGKIEIGLMSNLMIRGWFVYENKGTITSTASSSNVNFFVDSENSSNLGGFVCSNGTSGSTGATSEFSTSRNVIFGEDTFVVKNNTNNSTATMTLNGVTFGRTGGFAENNEVGSTIDLTLSSTTKMSTNKGNLKLSGISGSSTELTITNNAGKITSNSSISGGKLKIVNHGKIDGETLTYNAELTGLSLVGSAELKIDTIYSGSTVGINTINSSTFTVTTNQGTIKGESAGEILNINNNGTMIVTNNEGTIGNIASNCNLSSSIVENNTNTIGNISFTGGSITCPVVKKNAGTISSINLSGGSISSSVISENSAGGSVGITFSSISTMSNWVVPTNSGSVSFTSTTYCRFEQGIIENNSGSVTGISISGGSLGQPAIGGINTGTISGSCTFSGVSLSSSNNYVGLLFAESTGKLGSINVSIVNCQITVSSGTSVVGMIGGIYTHSGGSNLTVDIDNSSSITVNSTIKAVGGAFGFINGDGTLIIKEESTKQFAPQIINATTGSTYSATDGVGGVVGVISNSAASSLDVTITGAFTPTISIKDTGQMIGGIVGQARCTTLGLKLGSYANITTNSGRNCKYEYIGGIVGYCTPIDIIGDPRGSTAFNGTMTLNGSINSAGGIFGYVKVTEFSDIEFELGQDATISGDGVQPAWKDGSGNVIETEKLDGIYDIGNYYNSYSYDSCYSAEKLFPDKTFDISGGLTNNSSGNFVEARNYVVSQKYSMGAIAGSAHEDTIRKIKNYINSGNVDEWPSLFNIKAVEIIYERISYDKGGSEHEDSMVRLTARTYSMLVIVGTCPGVVTQSQKIGNTTNKNVGDYTKLSYNNFTTLQQWQGSFTNCCINIKCNQENANIISTNNKNRINNQVYAAGIGDDSFATPYKLLTGRSDGKLTGFYIQIP